MQELKMEVNHVPGKIEVNYKQLEEVIESKTSEYDGAIVTPDSKSIMKKELASLRKFKADIEDRRKQVKSVWMKPYHDFEDKIKTLVSKIDVPIDLINNQIKVIENDEKKRKHADIRMIFDLAAEDIKDYVTLEMIYDGRWENTTMSLKKIGEDIGLKVNEIRSAIQAIKSMQSDAVPEALQRYKQNLNLSAALQYISQYEAQRREIEARERERIRQEEEERRQREFNRVREEERRRIADEQKIKEAAQQEIIDTIKEPISDEVVKNVSVTAIYTVAATPDELREIEMVFDSLGITWSRKEL